eukprot:TRINITY_DN9232_c0_g1_i1.p1 TRINITY_DN9232_c0_g1~~TRINITY_DN9232_c0_g1_i1.p1  ORF type:complete len:244 (-),score=77.43 TRINITY_DN9232_c0_g1_i1:101-781(-)
MALRRTLTLTSGLLRASQRTTTTRLSSNTTRRTSSLTQRRSPFSTTAAASFHTQSVFLSDKANAAEGQTAGDVAKDILTNLESNNGAIDEINPLVIELADKICLLNLLETAELQAVLQKRLGIPNEMLYGGGGGGGMAAAAAPVEEEVVEKEQAKTEFKIVLTAVADGAKFKVLKEIRVLKPGMNLMESKKMVENLPQVCLETCPKDDAETWVEKLKAVGGTIELQ